MATEKMNELASGEELNALECAGHGVSSLRRRIEIESGEKVSPRMAEQYRAELAWIRADLQRFESALNATQE